MFGRSKAVVLSHGSRRRKGPPRWLVLLLTGAVAGVAGVLLVQEKLMPPRLSASASTQLQQTLAQTQQERQLLQQRLNETTQRLEAALAEKKTLAGDLDASRRTVEQLRKGMASLVDSLPPDPRGGAVQVRAARFKAERGQLLYDVILSRERAGAAPRNAVMQLLVAGASKRGPETTVKLQPVPVSVGAFEALSGGVPLPEGFDPRQATVHVLDRPDGKLLGMRVLVVQ
jgi:septal ring factor EnvC (AmiA/AmiB activator)